MKEIDIQVVSDYDKIVSIWSSFADCFDGRIDICSSKFLKLMHKYCEKAITCCIYCNREIIGACTFYANDNKFGKAFISLLAVREDYRGNGYAGYLLRYVFHKSIEMNMKTISLEVLPQNTNAINLYLKNGFKLTSEKGEKIEMEKVLCQELM
mgnify:CR=1 FL=1